MTTPSTDRDPRLRHLMTVADVAKELGVQPRRVNQLIHGLKQIDKATGELKTEHGPILPATQIGRDWVILRDDFERINAECPHGWPGHYRGWPKGKKRGPKQPS